MPPSRNRDSGRSHAISSVLAQATSTTTTALTVPAACRAIVIVGATVKHYIRVSTDNALDLSASNAGILQVGGAGETLFPKPTLDGATVYLLVEATSSTGTVDVSYYT